MAKTETTPGVGCDVGTGNIVAARKTGTGVETRRVRDAFLELPLDAKKMLKLANVSYVERDEELLILGDAAMDTANIFGREARRPLSAGLVSSSDIDAMEILGLLIKNVLGEPSKPGEHCYFSVPAAPVDRPGQDVIYHRGVLERIVRECGFTPTAGNEAMAIIYAETAKENFSGIGLSFGAGMTNVALAMNTIEGLSFSVSRCLSKDFPVVTRRGVTRMHDIAVGDEILDANGCFVPVLEKLDNGTREFLKEVTLENLPAFPHQMTSDHRVFVRRRFGWEWVPAGDLHVGDEVGIPTVKAQRDSGSSYYFGRDDAKNITVAGARNLGRFFGVFLGDGSCGGGADGPRYVQLAFNRRDQHLIEKYATVCHTLFHRDVEIVEDDAERGVTRVKLHVTPVARHLRERFYGPDGEKVFPLGLENVSNQMALGILEGLLDSDGHRENGRVTFTNTSLSLVMVAHHLLNRFGVEHSISVRSPRLGGVNSRGVQIEGRKDCYEVRINGDVSVNVLDALIRADGNRLSDRFPEFSIYRVSSVSDVPYNDNVWDIRVASEHHSFSSPGMIVHNCGDWIDTGAAKSIGSTASRICAIKEKGVDLNAPMGRDQEAITFYYRNLIEYAIDQIALQFMSIQGKFSLPRPVPIIVSGGTSKAGGFLDLFKAVFEKKRKKFPIEVSEIRAASDPLNAVANGLLIQAMQEE